MTTRETKIHLLVHLLDSNLDYFFNYRKFDIMLNVENFRLITPTLRQLANLLPANRIAEIEQCATKEELEAALRKMLDFYSTRKNPDLVEATLFPNIIFSKEGFK